MADDRVGIAPSRHRRTGRGGWPLIAPFQRSSRAALIAARLGRRLLVVGLSVAIVPGSGHATDETYVGAILGNVRMSIPIARSLYLDATTPQGNVFVDFAASSAAAFEKLRKLPVPVIISTFGYSEVASLCVSVAAFADACHIYDRTPALVPLRLSVSVAANPDRYGSRHLRSRFVRNEAGVAKDKAGDLYIDVAGSADGVICQPMFGEHLCTYRSLITHDLGLTAQFSMKHEDTELRSVATVVLATRDAVASFITPDRM